MRLTQKAILLKVKHKNKGNIKLCKAIDQFIATVESRNWKSWDELLRDRPDADQVHNDGFYFFDINIHRTLVLMELGQEGEATIIWAGTHDAMKEFLRIQKIPSENTLVRGVGFR